MNLNSLPIYPPKLLIYGAPGTGKTCFVTSFGEGLELIDLDGNLQSARTLKDNFTSERLKIEVTPCLETDPFRANAWTAFGDRIRLISKLCAEKKYPFKVLGIDGFTSLGNACLRSIQINNGVLSKETAQKQKRMTQELWGMAIEELDRVMVFIKALPIPVVTIFHDTQDTVEEGDREVTYTKLNIFGKKLPATIVGRFDDVVRMKVRTESGKPVPYLQTIPDAFTTIRSNSAIPDGFKASQGLRALLTHIGWKDGA